MVAALAPGLHPDVPEAVYHADPCDEPSLSSSIAKVLLDQSPQHARWHHPRLNAAAYQPSEPTKAMDRGSAIHAMLLGKGQAVEVLPFDDFRKKDAQIAREGARLAGRIPLLAADAAEVRLVVDAARVQIEARPDLAGFFAPGRSEVTGVWRDHGATCRMRIDRLPDNALVTPFPTIFDLKTTGMSAKPEDFSRQVFSLGYDISAAFYTRGLTALRPHIRRARMVFIVLEQEPPYALSAIEVAGEAIAHAEEAVDLAIRTWARCIKANDWPGYDRETFRLGDVPAWRGMSNEILKMAMRTRLDRWQRPHGETAQ